MSTNDEKYPEESAMLRLVRQWRREAYEADQKLTERERQERDEGLVRQLGLRWYEPTKEQSKKPA